MTPTQTKRRIAVMQRHGEPGWRIQSTRRGPYEPDYADDPNPMWLPDRAYRAVRVETTAGKRVPLPWSTIRCGMVVRLADCPSVLFVVIGSAQHGNVGHFTDMEYLDGETWRPLWTEEAGEERIVEIVSEEGS